jgi:hypothetical protein
MDCKPGTMPGLPSTFLEENPAALEGKRSILSGKMYDLGLMMMSV